MSQAIESRKQLTGQLAITRLEPEEARELARQAHLARKVNSPIVSVPEIADEAPSLPEQETHVERPEFRPPMGMVGILDDGKTDGEWVRLRNDRYFFGRTEADICIPHDNMISSRHAELSRIKEGESYRWYLQDLQSSNGTFVRIGSTRLADQNEFLIGRGRYRYDAGAKPASQEAPPKAPEEGTQVWTADSPRSVVPSFIEFSPAGPVKRHPLMVAEYWIGRDPQECAINRPDDMLISPRHARLFRDQKGRWHLQNHHSLNGTWLRVDRIHLQGNCQFRLGEQIFQFRVP